MTCYNQATRTVQYLSMIYYCILNTITESANNSVLISDQHNYVINNISSGPILFKFLMNKVTIETRETITNIRMDLSSLDSYIPVGQFDIYKEFNLCVKEKRKQLRNRGEIKMYSLIFLADSKERKI